MASSRFILLGLSKTLMAFAIAVVCREAKALVKPDSVEEIRAQLSRKDSRLKSLSAAELAGNRGPHGIPNVLPVLRYDVINLSDGDKDKDVDKWLAIPGLDAVIHRASMGTDGLDQAYQKRESIVINKDLKWGAYHFLRQAGSGEEQAVWFVNSLLKDTHHPSSVLLVIDAEYRKGSSSPHPSLTQLVKCANRIQELTGTFPGIYTGQDFLWEQFNKARYDSATQSIFNQTWLWVARYSASFKKLTFPEVNMPPWERWTLWQVSDSNNGTPMLEGMPAEINVWKGEREELKKFWDQHSWDYVVRGK
jgi:GH25 family lysozyme M1 (1,4-beta-N-acetylmuramidase)